MGFLPEVSVGPLTGGSGTALVDAQRIEVTWDIDAHEQVSVNGWGDFSALTGGAAVVSVGLGSGVLARRIMTRPAASWSGMNMISENGPGATSILDTVWVDRVTGYGVSCEDIFNGAIGTVISNETEETLSRGNLLVSFEGIFPSAYRTTPNLPVGLRVPCTVDASLQGLYLDVDANRATLKQSVDSFCANILGLVIAGDSLPQGSRGHAFYNSGEGGSTPNGVTVGYVGTSPVFEFNDSLDAGYSEGSRGPVLDGSNLQISREQLLRSCNIMGGQSSHGMPDAGSITAIVNLPPSGDWTSGLAIVSIYQDRDHGGVYFWPHDGNLWPMSQSWGVNDLWYDRKYNTLYAATDVGLYFHIADPTDSSPWLLLGGFRGKCVQVARDSEKTYVLAQAVPNGQTLSGILVFPEPGTPVIGQGHDGWAAIAQYPSIASFSVISNVFYLQLTNDAARVHRWEYNDAGVRIASSSIDIGTSAGEAVAVTRLIPATEYGDGTVILGTYILTALGSQYFYYIDGTTVTLRALGTITDQNGDPVMVNWVHRHSGALNDVPVRLLAATNRGVFYCTSPYGGTWHSTNGQGGTGDADLARVSASGGVKTLGRTLARVYAVNSRSLYVSHNGQQYEDELAAPLDAGPYFNRVAGGNREGRAFAKLSTKVVSYGGMKVIRYLDNRGRYAYSIDNPNSQSPTFADRRIERSDIGTNQIVRPVTASQVLVDAGARTLIKTATEQRYLTIRSMATDSTTGLLRLRPGDMVTVSGVFATMLVTPEGTCSEVGQTTISGESYYVLTHSVVWDIQSSDGGEFIDTTTILGTQLLKDGESQADINENAIYQLSRMTLNTNHGRGR